MKLPTNTADFNALAEALTTRLAGKAERLALRQIASAVLWLNREYEGCEDEAKRDRQESMLVHALGDLASMQAGLVCRETGEDLTTWSAEDDSV